LIPSDLSEHNKSFLVWGYVAVWCAVIFALSAIPNYSGTMPDLQSLHGIFRFISRKTAHLSEYAVLMVLTIRAIRESWGKEGRWHFLSAFLFCVLYAAGDEWHQTFVFGRSGTVMDLVVDAVGACAGFIALKSMTHLRGK
jgi:hypothetical protein